MQLASSHRCVGGWDTERGGAHGVDLGSVESSGVVEFARGQKERTCHFFPAPLHVTPLAVAQARRAPHTMVASCAHPHDHVMAWSSLWIIVPLLSETHATRERILLSATMCVFALVSLQHWRRYARDALFACDVALAHVVFVWHLCIAARELPNDERDACYAYAAASASIFCLNGWFICSRSRALARGAAWSYVHLIPHASFRFLAFCMVMTARRASWVREYALCYVASVWALARTAQ